MSDIASILEKSLHHEYAKESEAQMAALENHEGFATEVLRVVSNEGYPMNIRLSGAVFFKNFIRRKWLDEDGNYKVSEVDVKMIKKEVIGLMIQLPPSLQAQIGEAVSIIADSEFPQRWPELIDELVVRIGEDMLVNRGVLVVAHSIFKRWRPLFRSDELFLEIKLVLDKFSVPFLKLFKHVDELVDQNVNSKEHLEVLLDVLLLLVKIYYDLNCQDIPEFFEDNLAAGMSLMHKYLLFNPPVLKNDEEEEQADLLTKVKTAICELIQLYTIRYEDVFGKLIPDFMKCTWDLLIETDNKPKNDLLVSKALTFMSSTARIPAQAGFYQDEEHLNKIITAIIIPNIRIRQADEELFEDDPIEFIRLDLEGADSESRKKSALELLKVLKEQNQSSVTSIGMKYVNQYLHEYLQSPSENWRSKDLALNLYSALAVKGTITSNGVTSINLLLNVVEFFTITVATDLVSDQVNPILKVDAIKYIYTFRNQLTKEQLIEAFQLLSTHLNNSEYVVYTYTAITLEKILSIKQHGKPLFQKADIPTNVLQLLITNLFQLITSKDSSPEKLAENEFLMICVMRILVVSEDAINHLSKEILTQLLRIIQSIAKNPSNPKFTHYTFESIAAVAKYQKTIDDDLLELVVPQLLPILAEDVQEFVPYIFQILAFLLEKYSSTKPLPTAYGQLIKPLMSPTVWEFKGNIPAVTRLLQAIIQQSPQSFATDADITPVLGVFQKLIASKVNDTYGFDLLETIFFNIDFTRLANYTKTAAMLLLQRLQNSKTEKFVKRFVVMMATFASISEKDQKLVRNASLLGPDFVIQFVDSVQNGIFGQILTNFIIPSSDGFNNLRDRNVIVIGLTNLISTSSQFYSPEGKYRLQLIPLLDKLTHLVTTESISGYLKTEDELDTSENEEFLFGSSFNKLNSIPYVPFTPVLTLSLSSQDLIRQFFKERLGQLNENCGGTLGQIFGSLSVESQQGLASMGI
ncbi:hypothetical protein LJB42_002518 [Komagataella kurtzmanii]|nr:hypothetical protein LJB42_002518 [Komagataella kurtzmanii]